MLSLFLKTEVNVIIIPKGRSNVIIIPVIIIPKGRSKCYNYS